MGGGGDTIMEPYPDLTSDVLKHNTLIRKLLRDSNITERQLAFHDQRFDDIATLLDRLRIDCGVVEPTREHAHVQEALGECSHAIIPETANDVTSDNSSCARVLAPVIAALDTVDKLFGHVCPKIENVQEQVENLRKKVDTAQSSQECRDSRLISLEDENARLTNRVEVEIGQSRESCETGTNALIQAFILEAERTRDHAAAVTHNVQREREQVRTQLQSMERELGRNLEAVTGRVDRISKGEEESGLSRAITQVDESCKEEVGRLKRRFSPAFSKEEAAALMTRMDQVCSGELGSGLSRAVVQSQHQSEQAIQALQNQWDHLAGSLARQTPTLHEQPSEGATKTDESARPRDERRTDDEDASQATGQSEDSKRDRITVAAVDGCQRLSIVIPSSTRNNTSFILQVSAASPEACSPGHDETLLSPAHDGFRRCAARFQGRFCTEMTDRRDGEEKLAKRWWCPYHAGGGTI